MVNLGRVRRTDRSQGVRYLHVARSLRRAANDLNDLAAEGDSYGNAMAIVAIHAAIAYTDALCISYREIKSVDGDHRMAAAALRHAVGARIEEAQVRRLENILDQKTAVSYQGQYYSLLDARFVLDDVNCFSDWAITLWEQRP